MSKMNKKSINYGFKILTILAFSLLVIPAYASAEISGYVTPYNSTGFNNNVNSNPYFYNYQPPTYYQPQAAYYQPQTYYYQPPVYNAYPVTTVYSNSASQNKTSATTTSKTTAKTETTTDNSNSTNNNANSLAANAVYGSDSFLPSGLLQWILLAIFIFLIIILARKVFGARKNYEESPMKHA